MPPVEPRALRREASLSPGFDFDPRLVARALCRLGHVRDLTDLGSHGPLDASAGRDSTYACLFGRDSIRMAFDLIDDFPEVARTTILRLTGLQGERDNPRAEEEPGRILHEHRRPSDPACERMREHWDFPYFGAVDTTPLYVCLVRAYCGRYGPDLLAARARRPNGAFVSVREGVAAALGWIDRRLARDGYVVVLRVQPLGLQHQFWEDSYDSQFHADGRLFDPEVPYAPVAVQGYAYDALLAGARLAEISASMSTAARAASAFASPRQRSSSLPEGMPAYDQRSASGPAPRSLALDPVRASHWRAAAELLRCKVLRDFWLPELGTFAPALVLDASAPTPARVVASSPGHLLASRLLDGPDAAGVREKLLGRLFEPDMLARAGIRTKSALAPRFHPGSYHNGSVWPVDTGVIADGLRRHGRSDLADELEDRIVRACTEVGAPVEFFRGDVDGSVRINTHFVETVVDGIPRLLEQPPQLVQGWTVTRLWRILRHRGLVPAELLAVAQPAA